MYNTTITTTTTTTTTIIIISVLIMVSTCILCDLGVQLHHLQKTVSMHHLHSEQVQVFWSAALCATKTSRGQRIVDLCSSIRLLEQLCAVKCQQNKGSVATCQQELHHEGDNTSYINKVTFTGSEIPSHCLKLHSLHTQRYFTKPGKLKEPYVIGYMMPCNDSKLAD